MALAVAVGLAFCIRCGPMESMLRWDEKRRAPVRTDEFLPFEGAGDSVLPAAIVPGGAPLRIERLAGTYDGSDQLTLLPDGEWTCTRCWGGCIRFVEEARGHARVTNGRVEFRFLGKDGELSGESCEALPVWWGDRLYLLGAEDVPRFCNAVNWGHEPREEMYIRESPVLVRDRLRNDCHVDEPVPQSAPLLPAEIDRCILRRKLVAHLVAEGPDGTWLADAGSDKGVFVGMRLRTQDGKPDEELIVEQVTEAACRIRAKSRLADGLEVHCDARGARFYK